MKIKTLTGQILHVEKNAVTQILLDAGLASIVTDAPAPVQSTTRWTVGLPGCEVDTKNVEPRLHALCSNPKCALLQQLFYGPTVGKTARFAHCGRVDTPPADIAKKYEKFRAAWAEKD